MRVGAEGLRGYWELRGVRVGAEGVLGAAGVRVWAEWCEDRG